MGYFRYRNYDSEYHRTTTQRIWFDFARENLFPKFDTSDIPNYDELAGAFRSQYQISDDDMKLYEDIKAGRKHIALPTANEKPELETLMEKRSLRAPMGRYPGETVIIERDFEGQTFTDSNGKPIIKRYEVIQKDWDVDEGMYRYRLREILDYVAQSAAMDEGGLPPIEEDGGDGLSA